jgi:hypothetical protein
MGDPVRRRDGRALPALDPDCARRQSFWLVRNGKNPSTGGAIVSRYVRSRLETLDVKLFQGVELRHLRPRSSSLP